MCLDMTKHVAIVVDWFGPYDREGAVAAARRDFGSGMYMCIGKHKYQKSSSRLQYIGISDNLCNRISDPDHHVLAKMTQELKIWLGEIATYGVPGKKNKATDPQLDLAEWLHIYFLRLPLTEKKMEHPPYTPATVLNRWWFTDYETPRKQRPSPCWPDLIDFLGVDHGARVIWFGRKTVRWSPSDF